MMAHRGRHIDIGIGVVQRMKAPQKRHGVFAPVHEVTQKVEQQKTAKKLSPTLAIGQDGKLTPATASNSGRNRAGGANMKLTRTRFRIQNPRLPKRRLRAGNSRLRRGPQNSHAATTSRLPETTIQVRPPPR